MTFYFAYGSLMDLNFVKDLGVNYQKAQSGIIKNYQFKTNIRDSINSEYGYANIVQKENYLVEGVIMQIPNNSLSFLDSYEGYPFLYRREKLEVYLSSTKNKILAWAYIGELNSSTNKNLLLSKVQKERIKNGFKFLSIEYKEYIAKTFFL